MFVCTCWTATRHFPLSSPGIRNRRITLPSTRESGCSQSSAERFRVPVWGESPLQTEGSRRRTIGLGQRGIRHFRVQQVRLCFSLDRHTIEFRSGFPDLFIFFALLLSALYSLDLLVSPLRRSNPLDNWAPRQIALF